MGMALWLINCIYKLVFTTPLNYRYLIVGEFKFFDIFGAERGHRKGEILSYNWRIVIHA